MKRHSAPLALAALLVFSQAAFPPLGIRAAFPDEPMPSPSPQCLPANPDFTSYIPQCDLDNESVEYCPSCAAPTLDAMAWLSEATADDTRHAREWTGVNQSLDAAWFHLLALNDLTPFQDKPDEDPLEDQIRPRLPAD